jgi:ABC-type multidrug transport system fused ATPase/permease subunit
MSQKLVSHKILLQLWKHFSRRRRLQIIALFVLILIASALEAVSVSSLIPLLTVMTAPEKITSLPFIDVIYQVSQNTVFADPLLLTTVIFISLSIVSAVIRWLLLCVQVKLNNAIGLEISVEIYKRSLYKSYEEYLNTNSSSLISIITNKIDYVISHALNPVVVLVTSLFMTLAILGTLLFINFVVTTVLLICLALVYIFVIKVTYRILLRNSSVISIGQTEVVRIAQEGMGGMRDILLHGSQAVFLEKYAKADSRLRRAHMIVQIVGGTPRFVLETFAVILLVVIAYILTRNSSEIGAAIPVLGLVALSVQRLLPLAQNSFASWSSLQTGLALVSETVTALRQPLLNLQSQSIRKIQFERSLRIENVSFKYDGTANWVLQNVSLVIPRGAKVGIIGPTGGGKSTLLDILMGLLAPIRGKLVVDDIMINQDCLRSWQDLIAHVPQTIFLADSSIAENIAFGEPAANLDRERIADAASKAELSEVIDRLPMGFDTKVGERGIKLSGGQRQRIGLARAIYKNARVIIFDEATSSLDIETERLITNSINLLSSETTTFTVAHRWATLKHCDVIFLVENGQCRLLGSYSDLEKNESFKL